MPAGRVTQLPPLTSSTTTATITTTSTTTNTAAVPTQYRRVLVVEDAPVCRAMLRKVLKSLDCVAVDEAEDGATAVDMVRARLERGDDAYDLILCDNVMPNMVGPEAVGRIRALGYRGPIFGVTGNMVQCDVDEFLTSGCDEILAKPLKIDTLAEAMRRHSDKGRRRESTGGRRKDSAPPGPSHGRSLFASTRSAVLPDA
jgi:CheY-like chemotaxis protein